MDKTQNSGISLKGVSLQACELLVVAGEMPRTSSLSYGLAIVSLDRQLKQDGAGMDLVVGLDLMNGVEQPAMKFSCKFLVQYSRTPDSAMTWDEFKNHIALAHLLPFVREFVSNMTCRVNNLPPLMLPPTNAHRLVKDYLNRQSSAASDRP